MSNIIYNGERLLQMVRYSDELLDEIKSKNDIVDIVSQYVVLKRAGRNYMGLCPFHKEKSGSFCVSRQANIPLLWMRSRWKCFSFYKQNRKFEF